MQKPNKSKAATVPQASAAQRQSARGNNALGFSSPHGNLAQLAQTINQSPCVQAQRSLQMAIDNSPRMVAQRRQLEGMFGRPMQRKGIDEKEPLHGKLEALQKKEKEEKELLQGKFPEGAAPTQLVENAAPPQNNTGLPDNLKAGIENLSGLAMDDVKVHYNSSKPAQLQAHAYTQGTDIHVAPGQEQHLPHEAWHVVQQKQGRVRPTVQAKGVAINDDQGLEKEADMMGDNARQLVVGGIQEEQKTNSENGKIDIEQLPALPFTTQRKDQVQLSHLSRTKPDNTYSMPIQLEPWSTMASLDGRQTDVTWALHPTGAAGVEMVADPLGPEHSQGGPPKSGVQSAIMEKLPTDSALDNKSKFIRGHLLNDNLGGPGEAGNLFPITAEANKAHELLIESKVKKWVNVEKHWVKYSVRVVGIEFSEEFNEANKNGFVNSRLECHAQVLDAPQTQQSPSFSSPAPLASVKGIIESKYKNPNQNLNAVSHCDEKNFPQVGAQSSTHTPLLSTASREQAIHFTEGLFDILSIVSQYKIYKPEEVAEGVQARVYGVGKKMGNLLEVICKQVKQEQPRDELLKTLLEDEKGANITIINSLGNNIIEAIRDMIHYDFGAKYADRQE